MNLRFYLDPETGGLISTTMTNRRFPLGWDEELVKKVITHYEELTEDEAVAEDEAAFENPDHTLMEVPNKLVPAVRELIAKRQE